MEALLRSQQSRGPGEINKTMAGEKAHRFEIPAPLGVYGLLRNVGNQRGDGRCRPAFQDAGDYSCRPRLIVGAEDMFKIRSQWRTDLGKEVGDWLRDRPFALADPLEKVKQNRFDSGIPERDEFGYSVYVALVPWQTLPKVSS